MSTLDQHRLALATAENDLDLLRKARDAADEALRAGAADKAVADLPRLKADRERARNAVVEAERKIPTLRGNVLAEENRVRIAEAEDARRTAEVEARRLAEESRAKLAEALAAPLATLAEASDRATDAVDQVERASAAMGPLDAADLVAVVLSRRARADHGHEAARIRAALGVEELAQAVEPVAALDAKHAAVTAAQAQVQAGEVHAIVADLAEPLFLLAASRVLASAALERIRATATAHPSRRVGELAIALAHMDDTTPVEPAPLGVALGFWLGIGAGRPSALASIAHWGGALAGSTLPPADVGRLVLSGAGHRVAGLSAERLEVEQLARVATATSAASSRGPVAHATAAGEELRHGRTTGRWNGDESVRTDYLRGVVKVGVDYLVDQVQAHLDAQVDPTDERGPFRVRTADGKPQLVRLPNEAPQLPPLRPGLPLREGEPPAPHVQIARYLKIEGTPEESLCEPIKARAVTTWSVAAA